MTDGRLPYEPTRERAQSNRDETLLARTCDRAEDAFDHLYGGVVFLMLLFGVQRLVAMKKYLKVVGAGLLDGGVKRD